MNGIDVLAGPAPDGCWDVMVRNPYVFLRANPREGTITLHREQPPTALPLPGFPRTMARGLTRPNDTLSDAVEVLRAAMLMAHAAAMLDWQHQG